MKRAILTLHVLFLFACLATASEKPDNDTTFYFNDKVVEVDDNNDQVDVRVFKIIGEGDSIEYKSVYKGVFSDEKTVEKYTVFENLGFNIPIIGDKKKNAKNKSARGMVPHWDGWSVGYSNMIQKTNPDEYQLASFDGVKIRPENSLEWEFNTYDHIIPLYRNLFGLTTGYGLSWRNYCLENNHHFEVINGKTELVSAIPGITYTRSRLRTLYITMPFMLEWQPQIGNNHKLFLTAGFILDFRAFANYKITYMDASGDKIRTRTARELNTRFLNLDYIAQIGYNHIGLYAKYCPLSFFTTGNGPDAQAVSIGIAFR